MSAPDRRLLLFHAHPDDETIGTGATMACYADAGVAVTLVTSTLGEEGEVLVPALSQLAADVADQLGGLRIAELRTAMQSLGVADHRFLGGAGHFRDSGMIGTPANGKPRAFWRAVDDRAVFDDAVAAAVGIIREVRPQVLITYDTNGDYGHPDHIMTHRVATEAVERAADTSYRGTDEPWQVEKVYWTGVPKSVLARGVEALRDSGTSFGWEEVEDIPFGVEDSAITAALTNDGFGAHKVAAMRAHATQISVDGPFFALSNRLGREVLATEYFRLVRGEPAGPFDADGRETDLFAGTS